LEAGGGDVGHQAERRCDIVELEMRLQMHDAAEDPWATGELVHRDAAGYERKARPAFGSGLQIAVDIADQPFLQACLDLVCSLE